MDAMTSIRPLLSKEVSAPLFANGGPVIPGSMMDPFIQNRRCVMKRRTVVNPRYLLIPLLVFSGCTKDRITGSQTPVSGIRYQDEKID